MKICDLISVHDAARAIDLASVEQLAADLAREGADLTLGSATQLAELLGEYVTAEEEPVDVLRVILGSIARNGERGGAFLVRGSGGSGKSHVLAAIALLLRHAAATSAFVDTHPSYADLRDRLRGRRYLVVPIPLAEHRGHDEHLEDIVFDRTERALRSAAYDIAVPLSEQSYALDLIDRHIVPRYSQELDAYTKQHATGARDWGALREKAPAQAVQIARRYAQDIQYPLDFRQSRVERLSTLLDIIREERLAGIVWLLDDLNEFLSGVGPKAVHGDCAFLDFIGQRCKISPLFMVATIDEGLEQLTSVEPYLLNAIRSSYRTDLSLSPDHMRAVARRRVIGRVDPDQYATAIRNVRAAYQAALGTVSFSEDELAASYPLHPTALECLESIAERFFGAADTLVTFMQDLLDQTNLAGVLQRDARRVITVDDVFDYLRQRIASHPEVSAYVYDVLDYYQKNASEVCPDSPQLCIQLTRVLIILRLSNVAASVPLIVEALGIDEAGNSLITVDQATGALEAMRLAGSFVDIRRTVADGPAIYYVDVQTSVSETVRRRIAAAKSSLAADDPRIWRHLLNGCDEAAFPLSQLRESRTLEIQWQNTFRCISAELADLTTFSPATIAEYVADLADPSTVEDACLFIAALSTPQAQSAAWRVACDAPPASRWSAALLAWLPRELTPQELDKAKEFAAIADMLEDERALGADSSLRDQLTEIQGPALAQARRIVRRAYYEGSVQSPFGHAVAPGELPELDGGWSGTLQTMTQRAFERVFPEFANAAPRRPLVAREQMDALVDNVIRPGAIALTDDDPLAELVHSFLVPLGVAVIREDECVIDVGRSKVAADVVARVRQRDQTPSHELGRPISCSDLAQHLVKSPLGLTPELFELTVAALIRTGHLAALRDCKHLVPFEDVATPLSGSVQYVARPPMLTTSQWQVLARVCRIALDFALPGPDLGVQQLVWERLLQARADYLDRAATIRRRLETHIADIDQRPAHWAEAFADLDAIANTFNCVRPELHPAIGLREFIGDVEDFIGDSHGSSRLGGLFRRIDALAGHLEKIAPEIVQVRAYLLSPDLNIPRGSELEGRRQSIEALIATGENVVSEEGNLRRLVQVFLASYKRAYLSWHGRVYRSPVFDQYRTVHQSPEMRALHQLSKLHIDVKVTAQDMAHRIDEQVRRRCARPDLSELLDHGPVCPDCRLRLNEQPELLDVAVLVREARQALQAYVTALTATKSRQAVEEYAAAMPRHGDIALRLGQVLDLDDQATTREIISLFTDEAILHLNRALAGKVLAPRNFAELRKALEGRTVTKEEAQELFKKWIEGEGEDIEDEGLLQIDG